MHNCILEIKVTSFKWCFFLRTQTVIISHSYDYWVLLNIKKPIEIWAIGCNSCEDHYSFPFSNVGSLLLQVWLSLDEHNFVLLSSFAVKH